MLYKKSPESSEKGSVDSGGITDKYLIFSMKRNYIIETYSITYTGVPLHRYFFSAGTDTSDGLLKVFSNTTYTVFP